MRVVTPRTLAIAALGLWLAGCSALTNTQPDGLGPKAAASDALAAAPAEAANAEAVTPVDTAAATEPGLFGSNAGDDLNEGKKYFRAGNYGMAERYFRRAVELHPRDAESWIGLAAAYDRLRRFDLADRAYNEAIRLVGPTVEILNNQGYSYMLRGDLKRARDKLLIAQRKDPANPFVQNNLQLLAAAGGQAKAVE
jgi:Flp pilus assembly protein TadD